MIPEDDFSGNRDKIKVDLLEKSKKKSNKAIEKVIDS